MNASTYRHELDKLAERLRAGISPWIGGVEALFSGLVRFTSSNNGYVCDRIGMPDRSTWFWVPDRELKLREDGRHYDYLSQHGARGLAYVGERAPPAHLPAGTLVRVSLAKRWKPGDADIEERCYLQLSGWF